jgi:protein SCO1/2
MLKAGIHRHSVWIAALLSAVVLIFSVPVFAHPENYVPGKVAPLPAGAQTKELQGVGIDEKLGHQLDLNLKFKNENGETVTLGSFFASGQPVILSPVYFSCPGLCNFHLNGLTDGLKELDWNVGDKFQVLSISFDARETPDLAAKKKETYMKLYGRAGAEKGWHFLTADQATITAFTDSIGFKYHWNEKANDWAHASTAIAVSPKGVITRYLPGILFEPKDLKLAVIEAGKGEIGTFVDQLVLYCFHYNPTQSKYTLYAFNIMKAGGGLIVLFLGLWLLPVWYRSRRQSPVQSSAQSPVRSS